MDFVQISIIAGVALAAGVMAFMLFASVALGGRMTRFLLLPYLAVLVLFSGANWGVVDAAAQNNLYSRGSGVTYFGFVNLYLYWLGLAVLVHSVWSRLPAPKAAVRKYLAAFAALFAGHLLVGLYLGVPLLSIASRAGVLHVINMVVLVYVLLRVVRDEQDGEWLLRVFLALALARGAFGLVRFAFFGGDPANYYANFQKIAVRLTFFDINDSVLLGLAAFIAVWRLFSPGGKGSLRVRLFHWAVAVSGTACVVLSYRRTAWIGLILAAVFFLWVKRRQVNWLVVLPALVVTGIALGTAWLARFEAHAGGGLLATLFPDVTSGGRLSASTGRFVELELAMRTIRGNWLLGVGSWGEYTYSTLPEVSFHQGRFEFMHSGFLHIWLKTGVVGLLLFVAALASASRQSLVGLSQRLPDQWRGFSAAGLAGVILLFPTLLFGTPIIEYRTMQVLGLVLAMPFIARSIGTPTDAREQLP